MARPVKHSDKTKVNKKFELCAVPPTPDRILNADVDAFRASLIRYHEKKWVNGTILRYYFVEKPAKWRGDSDQKKVVRDAFRKWKNLGIGLEFHEVEAPAEAEIRIGFEHGKGSWSYVGRDAVDRVPDPSLRTMNFGWDLTTTYGRDTALHEIGHALGFPHEHQNPAAGIVWNVEAVVEEFSSPPNCWNETKIYHNILNKIAPQLVEGSEWDPNSIMHYSFPKGLICKPKRYREEPLIPEPGLSPTDVGKAKSFYPPLKPSLSELRPFQSAKLSLRPGEQVDFLIVPTASRKYTVQTFGYVDSVMVLFEQVDGTARYICGDDDGGTDGNACVSHRLVRGRTYIVRIRLYYASRFGDMAVMLW